ncbi:exopolysaccharide phosphotransferase cps2G [Clostridia bacterium]|nr:exopolysaccharide phosphotransferase cps2G [Clostridia bacterium]
MITLGNHIDDIDIVVLWLDGNDSEWLMQRREYELREGRAPMNPARYREWHIFKYWFRAVEKYAPWIRTVHLVTCGHLPSWLNCDHPKLHIVRHSDFMPAEYLPTFNGMAIEVNIHKIPGLSEHFIYSQDDIFFADYVKPSDFFKDGMPCEALMLDNNLPLRDSHFWNPAMNTIAIQSNFSKRKCIRENFFKWINWRYGSYNVKNMLLLPWPRFEGFHLPHVMFNANISLIQEAWEKEYKALETTSLHKFRDNFDLSFELFRDWHLVTGRFAPRSPWISENISLNDKESTLGRIRLIFSKRKRKMLCINDNEWIENLELVTNGICSILSATFPDKSSFEK